MIRLFLFFILFAVLFFNNTVAQDTIETFNKEYKGQIDKYKIRLSLINRFTNLSGNYNYLNHPDEYITFSGKKKGNEIHLSDDNPAGSATEHFFGKFINDSTITGTWKNDKGKQLKFTLTEVKKSINSNTPTTITFENIDTFNGKDPWESNFFEKPLVQEQLKQILKSEYKEYLEFLTGTAYMSFSLKNGLLYDEFFYAHVGCTDQSMLVIDSKAKKFYLCWLKEDQNDIHLYPESTIPENILKLFVDDLNQSWGFVATFTVQENKIVAKEK